MKGMKFTLVAFSLILILSLSVVSAGWFSDLFKGTGDITNEELDQTPRISYWWSKVNQHTENGIWMTDPEGDEGADIDMLKYCQEFYPNTVEVKEYKLESINDWRDAGNVGSYVSTKMSYECVQTSSTESENCVQCAAPKEGCQYTGSSCNTCGTLICEGVLEEIINLENNTINSSESNLITTGLNVVEIEGGQGILVEYHETGSFGETFFQTEFYVRFERYNWNQRAVIDGRFMDTKGVTFNYGRDDDQYIRKIEIYKDFYVKAKIDGRNQLNESNEEDNCIEQKFKGAFDSSGSLIEIIQVGEAYSCIKELCFDSDGGIDIYEKGTLTTIDSKDSDIKFVDFCRVDGKLSEFNCRNFDTFLQRLTYDCPNGCLDGACISDDKEEINLENLEEITEIEEEIIVSEEEEETYLEESFKETYVETIPCDGCLIDEKCFPYGYRKASQFCSPEGMLVQYSENKVCENNFECLSNLCINSQCISSSVWQKIMAWFSGIF